MGQPNPWTTLGPTASPGRSVQFPGGAQLERVGVGREQRVDGDARRVVVHIADTNDHRRVRRHRFRSRVARADQRQQLVEPEPQVLTLLAAKTGSTHRVAVTLCIARVATCPETA